MIAVLVIGALILGSVLRDGWYPHDEGALGQSAERVLAGEVPHRDFTEIYTGLLSYINAAVFAVLPVSSIAMRVPLFLCALLWLGAMYRVLLRFTPPVGAGLAALTAFVWSVPNYPAPIPSWYILFLATFAALALVRWHETAQARWLVIAGAMGGVAFLFKLTGIFVLMGGGLALVAAEIAPGEPAAAPAPTDRPALRRGSFAWVIPALLLLAVLALGRVAGGADRELLRFVVPTAVLALGLAARIAQRTTVPDRERWRALAARLAPFLMGAAVPVLTYLAIQAALGALPTLLEGVFVTPFRRVTFASMRPPSIASLLFFVPLGLLLWVPSTRGAARRAVPVLAALWFGAIVLVSGTSIRAYQFGWMSAWGLLFFVALEGAVIASRAHGTEESERNTGAAITLACMAVSAALVEFPFAAPIYTLYALPVSIIAAVALVRVADRVSSALQFVALGFLLTFGLVRVVPGSPGSRGLGFAPSMNIAALDLPRSGLRVEPLESVVYEGVIRLVQEKAVGGPIWAGPDAPEIYFLSGLPNRTRTFFDFLDGPAQNSISLVDRIAALEAKVVVVKKNAQFSPALTLAVVDSLRRTYSSQRDFPGYLVLWR
ncbi:MAG: glycosyltransferase family 39 protein [Gemmatimonadetes bacterium]|nr:glycosyltransferase family 39 protein [Gemmatimonadota bacterium]